MATSNKDHTKRPDQESPETHPKDRTNIADNSKSGASLYGAVEEARQTGNNVDTGKFTGNIAASILPHFVLFDANERKQTKAEQNSPREEGKLKSGEGQKKTEPRANQTKLPGEIPVPGKIEGWQNQHEALVEKAKNSTASIVIYGDSITKGMSEGDALKHALGPKAENFGIKSDGTQNLLWRLQNGEAKLKTAPDVAVLLIGANNVKGSKESAVAGVLADAKELSTRQPNTKLLVLGVLPQGKSADDPRREKISEINKELEARLANEPNLRFFDAGKLLLEPNGDMDAAAPVKKGGKPNPKDAEKPWSADGVHPHNYTRFFDAIKPVVEQLRNGKPADSNAVKKTEEGQKQDNNATDFKLNLSPEEKKEIGARIRMNESHTTEADGATGLTFWNKSEAFPSLGIGHNIWQPAGSNSPFGDSFRPMIKYMEDNHVKGIPSWLNSNTPCPWNTREQFEADAKSPKMAELRNFLANTVPQQTEYAAYRLEQSLPKILESTDASNRQQVESNFHKVLNSGANGTFALLDYVNFKGEGYNSKSNDGRPNWGLRQVLENMKNTGDPVKDFSDSARQTLERRVANAPAGRKEQEQQWLQGWTKRVEDYYQHKQETRGPKEPEEQKEDASEHKDLEQRNPVANNQKSEVIKLSDLTNRAADHNTPDAIVRIPANFDKSKPFEVAVYNHGWGSTAESSFAAMGLDKQMEHAKPNTVLIVPEWQKNAGAFESKQGSFEDVNQFRNMMQEIFNKTPALKGKTLDDVAGIHIMSHSAGWTPTETELYKNDLGNKVKSITLLDSNYDPQGFEPWIKQNLASLSSGEKQFHNFFGPSENQSMYQRSVSQANQIKQMLAQAGLKTDSVFTDYNHDNQVLNREIINHQPIIFKYSTVIKDGKPDAHNTMPRLYSAPPNPLENSGSKIKPIKDEGKEIPTIDNPKEESHSLPPKQADPYNYNQGSRLPETPDQDKQKQDTSSPTEFRLPESVEKKARVHKGQGYYQPIKAALGELLGRNLSQGEIHAAISASRALRHEEGKKVSVLHCNEMLLPSNKDEAQKFLEHLNHTVTKQHVNNATLQKFRNDLAAKLRPNSPEQDSQPKVPESKPEQRKPESDQNAHPQEERKELIQPTQPEQHPQAVPPGNDQQGTESQSERKSAIDISQRTDRMNGLGPLSLNAQQVARAIKAFDPEIWNSKRGALASQEQVTHLKELKQSLKVGAKDGDRLISMLANNKKPDPSEIEAFKNGLPPDTMNKINSYLIGQSANEIVRQSQQNGGMSRFTNEPDRLLKEAALSLRLGHLPSEQEYKDSSADMDRVVKDLRKDYSPISQWTATEHEKAASAVKDQERKSTHWSDEFALPTVDGRLGCASYVTNGKVADVLGKEFMPSLDLNMNGVVGESLIRGFQARSVKDAISEGKHAEANDAMSFIVRPPVLDSQFKELKNGHIGFLDAKTGDISQNSSSRGVGVRDTVSQDTSFEASKQPWVLVPPGWEKLSGQETGKKEPNNGAVQPNQDPSSKPSGNHPTKAQEEDDEDVEPESAPGVKAVNDSAFIPKADPTFGYVRTARSKSELGAIRERFMKEAETNNNLSESVKPGSPNSQQVIADVLKEARAENHRLAQNKKTMESLYSTLKSGTAASELSPDLINSLPADMRRTLNLASANRDGYRKNMEIINDPANLFLDKTPYTQAADECIRKAQQQEQSAMRSASKYAQIDADKMVLQQRIISDATSPNAQELLQFRFTMKAAAATVLASNPDMAASKNASGGLQGNRIVINGGHDPFHGSAFTGFPAYDWSKTKDNPRGLSEYDLNKETSSILGEIVSYSGGVPIYVHQDELYKTNRAAQGMPGLAAAMEAPHADIMVSNHGDDAKPAIAEGTLTLVNSKSHLLGALVNESKGSIGVEPERGVHEQARGVQHYIHGYVVLNEILSTAPADRAKMLNPQELAKLQLGVAIGMQRFLHPESKTRLQREMAADKTKVSWGSFWANNPAKPDFESHSIAYPGQ